MSRGPKKNTPTSIVQNPESSALAYFDDNVETRALEADRETLREELRQESAQPPERLDEGGVAESQ